MKLRHLLGASGALLLAGSASAQTDLSAKILPTGTPAQQGGVYDLASGTWSSNLSALAAGASVLYDNTCEVGKYLSLAPGEVVVDAGRLPSTSSPDDMFSKTGTADDYDLHVLELSYCTSEPSVDLRVNLYECYDSCSDATALIPDYSFDVLGAPGSAAGALACWTIQVDLGNLATAPNLKADCNGAYDNVRSTDLFGWSFEQVTAAVTGPAGPIVAGDPFGLLGGGGGGGCAWGDGTAFGSGSQGTGIGTDDLFEIDAGGALQSCSYFGGYFVGNDYASIYLEVGGGTPAPPAAGTKFCFGDGSGTACPCSNDNDGSVAGGESGCANGSSAGGASLSVSGTNSTAAGDLVLSAEGLVPGQPGLYFQGLNAVNGGVGNVFGDGLRCAGGSVIRLGVKSANGSGQSSSAGIDVVAKGGVASGDTRRYQLWYRDPAGSPCGNAFNLTNGVEVVWQP